MSDNQSARRNDSEPESTIADDDVDESNVMVREPRAPSITRLGRYRLVREIASGGMASVNLAVAEGLDKLVALKIIHPHLAQEENFVRMFLDEARLASAISHRNVCNVFDFGETDGRYYIAMDYLAGQSLRDVLRRMRKLDLQLEPLRIVAYVAYMIAEACEGLHAAHELHGSDGQPLNVVHRDVSPHNLFVTYDGNVSVVDFGIARASDRVQSTATGVLKGKFSYMAPEQMRQLEIDRRADIWALGVVLWESLTLSRLFVRASQADTVMSVMMDRLRPPSEVRPDIPKELDQITMHAIARNPAHRYATAREMGRELMRFCRESGVLVGPIEIENFMEKLFSKELEESKALLRKAKHANTESGVWRDVTPSGFARAQMRSGSMEKARWPGDRPSAGSDAMGGVTQTSSMRNMPRASQAAPRAEALRTARPSDSKVRRYFLGGLLCSGAIAAGAWLALMQPVPEHLAATEPVYVGAPPTGAVNGLPGGVPEAPTAPPPVPALPAPAAVGGTGGEVDSRAAGEATPARGAGRGNAATTHQDARASARVRSVLRPNPYGPGGGARAGDGESGNAPVEPSPAPVEPIVAPPVQAVEPPREEAPPPPAPAPVVQPIAPKPVPSVAPASPALPARLTAEAAIAELDVEGSLGTGIVSRMLGRITPALRSCYGEAAKRAGRNDFSPVVVSLVIDEAGAVRQVNAAPHPLPQLAPCAAAALKRARSERVPDVGTSQVRFKVTFTP